MNKTIFSLLLILIMSLFACSGGDSPSSSLGSRASLKDISNGLEPGEFEMDLSGFVQYVGRYIGDRPETRFVARTIRQSRERRDGSGGRTRVFATNAEGPYRISLRFEAQRQDEDPVETSFWLQLPAGAKAGQTYPIVSSLRAKDGEAYGGFIGDGYAWRVNNIEGSVYIAELGDVASLYVELNNTVDKESDRRLDAKIRMNKIPFDITPEGTYKIKGKDLDEERTFRLTVQQKANRLTILVGRDLYLEFDGSSPEPGTYNIARRRSEDTVSASVSPFKYDNIGGEIVLKEEDGFYSAEYSIKTEGGEEVEVNGMFQHLERK